MSATAEVPIISALDDMLLDLTDPAAPLLEPGAIEGVLHIRVSTGVGTGPNPLAAFDAALNEAGIANYNLLRLSSVVPPGSVIYEHTGPTPPLQEGRWGDRLYVVMAEQRTEVIGDEAWAGIGWVQDPETKQGLFVEHEGNSEARVRWDIEQSLYALMATRGIDYGKPSMRLVGTSCVDRPVCALVTAAFQTEGWVRTATSRAAAGLA